MRWYVLARVLVAAVALAALAFGWAELPGPPVLPFLVETTGGKTDPVVPTEGHPP